MRLEFPYGHKARLSSGQGIKWTCRHTHKKKCTHNFFVCKQTLLPGGVCAHMHIYLHQQILILLCIKGFGGVGGLEKPEKLLPPLWWYVHSPCFSHQHWSEPIVDSAATCDHGEGRNGNCMSAYPILPFVKQKYFNGLNPCHPPNASALVNPDIFPAAQLRSGSGPDRTTFQFHKDLYMCFTASS